MTLVRQCRRAPVLPLLFLLAAAAGCSTDDPLPVCENCEDWTQVTSGLARFADAHPADARWIVYSTIEKRTNASDANRESDEDVWLTYFDGSGNPGDNPKWQLTDDALGLGDNTAPRFSPTGGQIAFAHATPGGNFEVWRMSLTVPADPADPPLYGAPEIVVADARDPSWSTETRLYFVRGDKLFRIDLPSGPGAPVSAPLELTFSPPSYSSTDTYVDRHPSFASDGGAVSTSTGRLGTADVVLKAYEVDETVYPPDTTETRAWIGYQPPAAQNVAYPLFIGADTLRTPRTLQSLPVSTGGTFTLGARRDSRFLPLGTQTYCDTLITVPLDLQPGDVDTVSYYFRVVRGNLRVVSGIGLVDATWARRDQRESRSYQIASAGQAVTDSCLMPYQVQAGQIQVGQLEKFFVRGIRGPNREFADSAEVTLQPGKTTVVNLFPTGRIRATMVFAGNPSPLPLAQATAYKSGTTYPIKAANTDTNTGVFTLTDIPAGTFDVTIITPGTSYRDTTITGITVVPPATVDLGSITVSPAPNGVVARAAANVPPLPEEPEAEDVVYSHADRANDRPALFASPFRADGDAATVWRLAEDSQGRERLELSELFGSDFLIQHPAVTSDLGNGVRYVAYTGNDTGDWQLYVQRLQDWVPDGGPVQILTPGSSDNLSCTRTVFHPRWLPGGTAGDLSLLVALGDCPSNGFEGLGIDDNPWAVGEIRIWRVRLGPGF